MSRIDELLSQLNKESQFDPLNESFDMGSIVNRFNSLKSKLLVANGLTDSSLSPEKQELIKKVKTVHLNGTIRVVTYPNIHYEKKYKIDASILFDFIMKRISENANSNNKDRFNATEVVQEGIAYTFKHLTGSSPSRYMTIDDFKKNYRLYAFGSFKKVQLIPRIVPLTILAQRNPLIISYIENRLLYTQINNLNNYAKKVEGDFIKLLKSNPDLNYVLNSYMSCIERSIRALVNIYKIIRNTFIELQNEYFNIFRQVIQICEPSRLYNECCTDMNNMLNLLNINITKIDSLNESEESINFDESHDIINTMGIEFMSMIKKRIIGSRKVKDSIYKDLGIFSKIDCLTKEKRVIQSGLIYCNTLNIKKYIDISYSLLNNNQENISDNSLITLNSLSDLVINSSKILFDKETSNDINEFRLFIRNSIMGEKIYTDISLDDILVNIISLLSDLDYIDINYYEKFMTINDININSLDHFKNIIIGNISIIDSIYFTILEMIQNFIKIIKEI